MKNIVRNSVFIVLSILFYLIWMKGGEAVYGKIVEFGVNKVTANVSDIDHATLKNFKEEQKTMIFCKYPDRTTKISIEYCLPIVLLLAWNFSLFFDKRLKFKFALKLLAINFVIIYFLQIFFPLLLFNISASKVKSMSLFVGMQVFGFLVFFLILKDSLILKSILLQKIANQNKPKSVIK